MEKYKVTLTVAERQALDRMVSSGKAAARKLIHARILLLGDEGPGGPRCSDEEIAEALDVGLSTIIRVRRRFVTESLESALHPRPRPPQPDKVKIQGEVEEHLIRLACSDPPAGRCCWTLQLLAERLIALGCFPNVSRETVRQALKKTRMAKVTGSGLKRPHLSLPQPPMLPRPSGNRGPKACSSDFCHPGKKNNDPRNG
jgi:transposase